MSKFLLYMSKYVLHNKTVIFSGTCPFQRHLQDAIGMGGALSPGVKRPGREADHSSSASAKVKKMWIYTPTPP
jgi:hypothetical protein